MSDAGRKLYEEFTGLEADKQIHVSLPALEDGAVPAQQVYLGRAVAIEYEIRKSDDAAPEVYRHEFTPAADAIVTTTEAGLNVVYILGAFEVIEAGITDAGQLEDES